VTTSKLSGFAPPGSLYCDLLLLAVRLYIMVTQYGAKTIVCHITALPQEAY
jgi:hypothetical protein